MNPAFWCLRALNLAAALAAAYLGGGGAAIDATAAVFAVAIAAEAAAVFSGRIGDAEVRRGVGQNRIL